MSFILELVVRRKLKTERDTCQMPLWYYVWTLPTRRGQFGRGYNAAFILFWTLKCICLNKSMILVTLAIRIQMYQNF